MLIQIKTEADALRDILESRIQKFMISIGCDPACHDPDAGDGDPCGGAFDGFLPVLCEPTVESQPFDITQLLLNPALRYALNTLDCIKN